VLCNPLQFAALGVHAHAIGLAGISRDWGTGNKPQASMIPSAITKVAFGHSSPDGSRCLSIATAAFSPDTLT
jgi:hypothetical protein